VLTLSALAAVGSTIGGRSKLSAQPTITNAAISIKRYDLNSLIVFIFYVIFTL
jgi:hypothetical protein